MPPCDARVGGAFALDMHTPDGVVEHRGKYVVVEPHTDGASLVTVTFTPQGDSTEVHVLHEKLPANKIEAHNGGWTSGLDKPDAFARRAPPSGKHARMSVADFLD